MPLDLTRIAAAPISWGVCEVPGWGYQLPAADVLADMAGLGLATTELGPDGFVPGPPAGRKGLLDRHGLRAAGAFCPLVLHDPRLDVDAAAGSVLDAFEVLGATMLVLSADSGSTGYDLKPELDAAGWTTLLAAVARIHALAAERGVTACLHPHVGTMVESRSEVTRFLEASEVPICLDAGHLAVGGTDPVELARQAADRVAHVHLKDVDLTVLETVRSGRRSYTEGVAASMYRVLGTGDLDLAGLVDALEGAGYAGLYVPEHDRMIHAASDHALVSADARASVDFLLGLRPQGAAA